MGGRLALYLAVTYPHLINKLILESASPGLAEPAARAARVHSDEALADQIERDGIGAFVEYWARIPLFASQQRLPVALRQRLRDQRLQNRPHGLANSLRGMGTGVQPSLWDRLSALTVPVLLLTGEDDDKFDAIAQQMATRLPNARHQTIPQAGHTIHLEQPEAYWATVGAFLNEQ
jgi:2-succinyl-6-hydroxy-2,4-cyclohexadiene-1-carboxylate synthase